LAEDQTRQERREERRRKKQERMEQHGKGLARVYKDAILKRVKGKDKKEP
jgi:hypothetical protein